MKTYICSCYIPKPIFTFSYVSVIGLFLTATFVFTLYSIMKWDESMTVYLRKYKFLKNYFLNITVAADKEECNFMTFKFYGRTGNLMFQYASFYGVAKTNNRLAFIPDDHFPLLNAFNLSLPVLTSDDINPTSFRNYGEPGWAIYDEDSTNLNCTMNITMDGYRNSWRYFDEYRSEIRGEFRFQPKIDEKCDGAVRHIGELHKFRRNECVLIGAHMRRGDFAHPDKQLAGHMPANGTYLKEAMEFFQQRFVNETCLKFLILGNDFEWNVNNKPAAAEHDVIVLEPGDVYVDLCVLSRCDHMIISSGSFGWWGAYLAGGEATYMKNQCRPGSDICHDMNISDYINPDWKWYPL